MLYHALQGAETYLMHVEDAEQAGESEIAQFFRDVIAEDRNRAEKAKYLLAKQWGK